jgi:hypothetical protein
VWALSALHSHSHYWLCYLGNTRVTATQFWCQSIISRIVHAVVLLVLVSNHRADVPLIGAWLCACRHGALDFWVTYQGHRICNPFVIPKQLQLVLPYGCVPQVSLYCRAKQEPSLLSGNALQWSLWNKDTLAMSQKCPLFRGVLISENN